MTDSPTRPVLRFAPSPNGRLHLGHAYSALLNAEIARALGGRLLLRIEDIDLQRARPELVAAIESDLTWLGLRFKGAPWRQSERFPVYAEALAALRARGLVYPCFCSRGRIAARVAALDAAGHPVPRDPDGTPLYPGTCRGLCPAEAEARSAAGETPAWRLDMARALAAEPGAFAYRRIFAEDAEPTLLFPRARRGFSYIATGSRGSPLPCGEVGVVPPASDAPSGTTPTPGPSPQGGGESARYINGLLPDRTTCESARRAGRGLDAARPASGERRSRSEGEGASEPSPEALPHPRLPPGYLPQHEGSTPSPRTRGEDDALSSIDVPADPARWGDVVLARRDAGTSYHLAVVVDDAAQGVTHVVRGQDLEAATDLHCLLQRLLGLDTPLYHHHGLIRAADGEKLAKSRGSESLADLRARGVSPGEVRARLGFA